eukprot:s251_g6.t1
MKPRFGSFGTAFGDPLLAAALLPDGSVANQHREHEAPIRQLWHRLWRSPPSSSFAARWQRCGAEILAAKEDQSREEEHQKQQRLAHWKTGIHNPNLRYLSRQEATNMIKRHWTEVWARQDQHRPAIPSIVEAIVNSFPADLRNWSTQWSDVQFGELLLAFRDASGSSGPDGWNAEEVCHLPNKITELFCTISCRWNVAAQVPEVFSEAKQANLPKEDKINPDHSLPVDQTRPISVLPIWWRIYAKALLKSPSTKEWLAHFIHPDVLCLNGAMGAEDAAAVLSDHWRHAKKGELCSLDWSKAFDHLHPEAITEVLIAMGWPRHLGAIIRQVHQHKRWICWDGHVNSDPLCVTNAIPQGCPLSPMLLAVVTSAGAYRQTCGQDIKQKIYIDDRTFWGASRGVVDEHINRWKQFSDEISFAENQSKIQRTSTSNDSIKFLGVCTVGNRRKKTASEQSRLDKAGQRAALLRKTGLKLDLLIPAAQSLVLSKAAYGWVARWPTKQAINCLFTAITKDTTNRMASPKVRNILYGTKANLDAILGLRLWARATRLKERDMLVQGNRTIGKLCDAQGTEIPVQAVQDMEIRMKDVTGKTVLLREKGNVGWDLDQFGHGIGRHFADRYHDEVGFPSFRGCVADLQIASVQPSYIEACSADNISAELSAAVIAMLASLCLDDVGPAILRPDLKLSAMLAADAWCCRAHPSLAALCQLVGSWFQKASGQLVEVRGHSQHPWNDLADALARHVVRHQAAVGQIDLVACRDLIRTGDLHWAWLCGEMPSIKACFPPETDIASWKIEPSCRRTEVPQTHVDPSARQAISFLWCSERALRLDTQWHQQKVAVIGLQESRRE